MLIIGFTNTEGGAMGLDLNLLVSLNALLEERSVSRAAARLGLSQPTLSTALGRLRTHFSDDLLVRTGNSYSLTPVAERLLESTGHALAWTGRVFETRPTFAPETSDRTFSLVLSDAQLPIFGRVLADLVRLHAPGVRISFQHSTARLIAPTHDWLPTVDAVVLPQGILTDTPHLDLYRDQWSCVVSADAGTPGELSVQDLATRPWVMPYHPRTPVVSALHHLRQGGVEARAEISTEDFLAVPYLVSGTDRIGLMPERVARLAAAAGTITIVQPPFTLGRITEALWWHPMHEHDPAHRWLRRMAAEAARALEEA